MILPGAEPFLMKGGSRGVMLIHGITGSPSEMKLLGEFLAEQGFSVLGVRLCGHGTSAGELKNTNWNQWYCSAEDGYHLLNSLCSDIAVVGLSMGGLLTLKLAAEFKLTKIVSLNTPIFIADKRLNLLPVISFFRSFITKKQRRLNVDPAYTVGYDCWPLSSINSLLELIEHVSDLLPAVTADALIMQSRHEHTVKPESAQYIYDNLGSKNKELVWWDRSGHVITLDAGYGEVYGAIHSFLQREGG